MSSYAVSHILSYIALTQPDKILQHIVDRVVDPISVPQGRSWYECRTTLHELGILWTIQSTLIYDIYQHKTHIPTYQHINPHSLSLSQPNDGQY